MHLLYRGIFADKVLGFKKSIFGASVNDSWESDNRIFPAFFYLGIGTYNY
jgi:hypothetical protein